MNEHTKHIYQHHEHSVHKTEHVQTQGFHTRDRTFSEIISTNQHNIAYIFLGIGLALFVLNITSLISFAFSANYAYLPFDISTFASIVVILLCVNTIFNAK
jgi:hypothetical protein